MNFKRYSLLLTLPTVLLIGNACTKKENPQKSTVQEPIKSPIAHQSVDSKEPMIPAKPKDHECSTLRMSSDKPSAVWKMQNGQQLVVCNLSEYSRINTNKISGWVNLFKRPVSLQNGFISEVNSELPSSQITFTIEKSSDTEVTITKYIKDPKSTFDDSYDIPATQFNIDCSGAECSKTAEKCIYKKPDQKIDINVIEYVEKISKGEETDLKKLGYYDVVIDSLINAALLGDPQAKKLVLETNRDSLKLDGAAAESFSDGHRVLTSLIEMNCLD
ncbi:MAG: hypothetical protein CL677_07665 [Bdellovibrionaceae bacterium]|nr:hypothetical protein [Pseudobdellovibrionaceae bacterium]